MRYISLDLETTGLDPFSNQIIEIAAVIEDTKERGTIKNLPRFHRFVDHKSLNWNVEALILNWDLMDIIIHNKEPAVQHVANFELAESFAEWLAAEKIKKCFFAGKNVGSFDVLFMKNLMDWSKVKAYHRYLDVGPLFFNPNVHEVSPDLYECAKIAGLNIETKHRAVDDAELVIALLRERYPKPKEINVGASNAASIAGGTVLQHGKPLPEGEKYS